MLRRKLRPWWGLAWLLALSACVAIDPGPRRVAHAPSPVSTPADAPSPGGAPSDAPSLATRPMGELSRPARRTRGQVNGMVRVPAGDFLRGSPPGVGRDSEQPQRQIHLDAFWIDVDEVTTDQYRACVQAGACTRPAVTESLCNWDIDGHGNHPINCVSWGQAVAYCGWVGKRLPTEAQWEKAARGTDGRTYPWGEEAPNCRLACMMADGGWGCGSGGTCPIAQRPAGRSPYGLNDMAGGVWEWTADFFASDHYANAPRRNPIGPATGERHSIRGGGYGMGPDGQRCANREGGFASNFEGGNAVGFRCARD